LDRTISTARAFLDSAFPALQSPSNVVLTGLPDGQQVVPVYSLGEDPLIRSYTQCPAYVGKLHEFYSSEEFLRMEAATNASRARVADVAPALNVSLANYFNVWDGFLVQREYGVGPPMPPINNFTFNEMENVREQNETRISLFDMCLMFV
jgi:hypothetical protein